MVLHVYDFACRPNKFSTVQFVLFSVDGMLAYHRLPYRILLGCVNTMSVISSPG